MLTSPNFILWNPSLNFDGMYQVKYQKRCHSNQTSPEDYGIAQQVDPMVLSRKYLAL